MIFFMDETEEYFVSPHLSTYIYCRFYESVEGGNAVWAAVMRTALVQYNMISSILSPSLFLYLYVL